MLHGLAVFGYLPKLKRGLGIVLSVPFLYFFFLFNWDSLHTRLNSHYKAWSYKKKKHKKIKAHRKSL